MKHRQEIKYLRIFFSLYAFLQYFTWTSQLADNSDSNIIQYCNTRTFTSSIICVINSMILILNSNSVLEH